MGKSTVFIKRDFLVVFEKMHLQMQSGVDMQLRLHCRNCIHHPLTQWASISPPLQ